MGVSEAEIRENIASHLALLDPALKVVAQEHYIKMPNGRKAYIDILAKDEFGCFTVIELKKSDQTARSAIQQLMKYANMLKEKNRLEENNIRCVVVSTVWRELDEAFDEYARVSQYDFKGYSVVYDPGAPPVFQEIRPKYIKGDLSPLKNFIFFEFFEKEERDKVFCDFFDLLEKIPSCNSVLIKSDYSGDDAAIIHPFGFSWVMFSSDLKRLVAELSKLNFMPLEQHHFDIGPLVYSWQLEGDAYEARSRILVEQVRFDCGVGEYTGLALHSLSNILAEWECDDPVGLGEMFADSLFDRDDMRSMACGFLGEHPYAFITKTTPAREGQFGMVRRRVNEFLRPNWRWQEQVDFILNTLRFGDVASIYIYNPLNFFGFLYDLGRDGSSKRIPGLVVSVVREDGAKDVYQGFLAWTSNISGVVAKDAVLDSYRNLDELKLRFINQKMNGNDEKLSEAYGLTYEVVTVSKGKHYMVQTSRAGCYLEEIQEFRQLDSFVESNDSLIDEVMDLLRGDDGSIIRLPI